MPLSCCHSHLLSITVLSHRTTAASTSVSVCIVIGFVIGVFASHKKVCHRLSYDCVNEGKDRKSKGKSPSESLATSVLGGISH